MTENPLPVLTTATVDRATAHLLDAFKACLHNEAERLERIASDYVDGLLLEAYKQGIQDGFVQGAIAASSHASDEDRRDV